MAVISAELKYGGSLETFTFMLNYLLRYLFFTCPDISKLLMSDFFEGLKIYFGYWKDMNEGRGD